MGLFLRVVTGPLNPQHQPTWVQHMPGKWGDSPEKERSCDQAVAKWAQLGFLGQDLSVVLTGRSGTVPFMAWLTPSTYHRVCVSHTPSMCLLNKWPRDKLNN